MELTNSYCSYAADKEEDNVHKIYHDNYYGFPIEDDNELFGRLILEINQAGLSWSTILKKADNFRKAYSNFNIRKIAGYADSDIQRLLNDSGIIRNRLKINACIYNAKKVLELGREFGSFKNWLDRNHPRSKADWVRLFKKTFKFTGGEITKEFLMSTGYLPGAHDQNCPVFQIIEKKNPPWMKGE